MISNLQQKVILCNIVILNFSHKQIKKSFHPSLKYFELVSTESEILKIHVVSFRVKCRSNFNKLIVNYKILHHYIKNLIVNKSWQSN